MKFPKFYDNLVLSTTNIYYDMFLLPVA